MTAAVGGLAVDTDARGRVRGVRVTTLPGSVAELRRALADALTAAIAEQHGDGVPSVAMSLLPVDHPHGAGTTGAARALLQDGSRTAIPTTTGRSDNGCLVLGLRGAGVLDHVGADPGWLAQTTTARLAAALTEAFAAAYDAEGRTDD